MKFFDAWKSRPAKAARNFFRQQFPSLPSRRNVLWLLESLGELVWERPTKLVGLSKKGVFGLQGFIFS